MASWRRQNELKKQQAKVCGCGKGYVSAHDNKCGHCRTKKEKKLLDQKFVGGQRIPLIGYPNYQKVETPKMLYYAGIGSRETPEDVQEMMARIGEQLADVWTVRSGFADGADKAFCFGAEKGNGKMENYLPWSGFNGAPRSKYDSRFIEPEDVSQEIQAKAYEIAKKFHPNWGACSQSARNMHARNVHQVLGHDLKTHSHMVVCWTPRGSGSGGTGQAIRIARGYGIPVFDLAIEEHKQKLVDFVALQERQNFEESLPW